MSEPKLSDIENLEMILELLDVKDENSRLREALIKLREWGTENGAGYVGSIAHNALIEKRKGKS